MFKSFSITGQSSTGHVWCGWCGFFSMLFARRVGHDTIRVRGVYGCGDLERTCLGQSLGRARQSSKTGNIDRYRTSPSPTRFVNARVFTVFDPPNSSSVPTWAFRSVGFRRFDTSHFTFSDHHARNRLCGLRSLNARIDKVLTVILNIIVCRAARRLYVNSVVSVLNRPYRTRIRGKN